MSRSELAVLHRAHQLFAGAAGAAEPDAVRSFAPDDAGARQRGYRLAAHAQQEALRASAQTDAVFTGILTAARADRGAARVATGDVLARARADAAEVPDTALAQREAMRRRAARLRAQHVHVRTARHRALQHRAALRGLGYQSGRRRGHRRSGLPLPPDRRAGIAVRAALSRLGRPYVWGAAGPNQFDCSGLTRWAYGQAGIQLGRTTYQQIYDGVPVPRSQIRPGDLVFPNAGHVQLAIGDNLVVEAPHPGAGVRISPLGAAVAIRRPYG